MNEAATLLAKCRERGISLRPGEGGKLKVSPPPEKLPGEVVEALKRHKGEVLRLLQAQSLYQELAGETPPAVALEVFPDWQGLLIKSSVLEMSVWVARSRRDGEELAKETGQPALLLDDVLRQQGRSQAEARKALLPLLITGTVQ